MRLSALLSIGCTGAPAAVEPGPDPDADTDIDTDSDTDTDTDTDTGEVAGPCPAYSGLSAEGTSWGWRLDDDHVEATGIAGSWTDVLVSSDGPEVRVEGQGSYTSDTVDSYLTDTILTWSCDDAGAALMRERTSYSLTSGGQTFEGVSTTTFDPPLLYVPADLALGSAWSVDTTATTRTDEQDSATYGWSAAFTAREAVEIAVPAGTYATLRVEQETAEGVGTTWLDARVGAVATDTEELTSWAR